MNQNDPVNVENMRDDKQLAKKNIKRLSQMISVSKKMIGSMSSNEESIKIYNIYNQLFEIRRNLMSNFDIGWKDL